MAPSTTKQTVPHQDIREANKSPTRPIKVSTGAQIQRQRDSLHIKPSLAFALFFTSHVVAALYSPIQDCDEVFNYWEPTHYLNHGHGFQTWEYSPEYAIRSWAYAGLHAAITPTAKILLPGFNFKAAEFFCLRIVLGIVCALCETRLFNKIAAVLNPRVSILYLLITVSSPGMFHAAIAYLPSSFAMYSIMLGMSAFMDWRGGLRTAQGIFCIGTGACLGWPFAAAMAIPFLFEELLLGWWSDFEGMKNLFWRVVDGTIRTFLVLAAQIAVDGFFYKKFVVVPFNIVWYNVFSSKGPDLYGTEPWHFYLRNLFLNFHIWLLLALSSAPLLLIQHALRTKGATKANRLRGIIFLTPFYLWLAIFTLQPHKEERFMYPAYPALALNAAIALHIILANIGSSDPRDLISRIPMQLRFTGILTVVVGAIALTASRTLGTMSAFGAPLAIYQPLHRPGVSKSGDTVCLGKEWYRFPSHYLLPDGVNAKFIKSEFAGLLPGEFSEADIGFGMFPGTWLIPPGMNDENREDVGKYTDVRRCQFMIDAQLPSTKTTRLEPSYINDTQNWEKIECLPFLDPVSSGAFGRLGWVPGSSYLPANFRRVWGQYCLLRRRQKRPDARISPPKVETLA